MVFYKYAPAKDLFNSSNANIYSTIIRMNCPVNHLTYEQSPYVACLAFLLYSFDCDTTRLHYLHISANETPLHISRSLTYLYVHLS